ncbi:hypothetical protein FACUT_6666 [Fusarium acutatum]|uniref:Uncharacterized protein n=1 Tax=Fusarium acutatum TaxID=78861 RepID=A0A8H4NFS4_9HYPO|nr:hypothetical protein FACUT_6666 [Fusarium acutatum]
MALASFSNLMAISEGLPRRWHDLPRRHVIIRDLISKSVFTVIKQFRSSSIPGNRNCHAGLLELLQRFQSICSFELLYTGTVFAETKMLCQSLIDQLTGTGEASLQGMISALTSQTYSQPGSENDSEFKDLAQSVSDAPESESAGEPESQQYSGLDSQHRFRSKIQATKQEIDAVVEKLGLYDGDNYIGTLDETFSMNQTFLNNTVEAAQAAKANWDRNMMEVNTAVTYIWIPVAGWISGSSAVSTKQNDPIPLVGAVNLLSMQNGAICDRLRSVGVALQEIQSIFAAIGNNLGQAATLMAAADASVRTSLIANQQAIQAGITKAVKEFQETLTAVQTLVAIESNIQTTGITADINAPSVFSENP